MTGERGSLLTQGQTTERVGCTTTNNVGIRLIVDTSCWRRNIRLRGLRFLPPRSRCSAVPTRADLRVSCRRLERQRGIVIRGGETQRRAEIRFHAICVRLHIADGGVDLGRHRFVHRTIHGLRHGRRDELAELRLDLLMRLVVDDGDRFVDRPSLRRQGLHGFLTVPLRRRLQLGQVRMKILQIEAGAGSYGSEYQMLGSTRNSLEERRIIPGNRSGSCISGTNYRFYKKQPLS